MKTLMVILAAFLIAGMSMGTACAQSAAGPSANQPASGTMQPNMPAQGNTTGTMGTQPGMMPGMGSMGMQPGMMAGMGPMMAAMCQGETVDATAIYVLRGNEVLKLDKNDLHVLASTTLPPMAGAAPSPGPAGQPPAGMAPPPPSGQGPAMQPAPMAPQSPAGQPGVESGQGPGQPSATTQPVPSGQPSTAPQPAAVNSSQPQTQNFNQLYMRRMVQLDATAIALSRQAVAKATNPEYKAFAKKTISNDEWQISSFCSLLHENYCVNVAASPDETDAAAIKKLSSLSGADFDIAYMRAMIDNSQKQVELAQQVPLRGTNPDVKAQSEDILRNKSAGVKKLREWLSSKYGQNP